MKKIICDNKEIFTEDNYINWLEGFVRDEIFISTDKSWHKLNDYVNEIDREKVNKVLHLFDIVKHYYLSNNLKPIRLKSSEHYAFEYNENVFYIGNRDYCFECFMQKKEKAKHIVGDCPSYYEIKNYFVKSEDKYKELRLVKIDNIYKKK